MPLRNQSVYQSTTTNSYQPPKGGYLDRSINPGCCSGSKRRFQILLLLGGVGLFMVAILSVFAGGAASPLALILTLLLAVMLGLGGLFLITLYMRTKGRCNFTWWPNRAARLSQNLTSQMHHRRSATHTTLTEDVSDTNLVGVCVNNSEEQEKLMEFGESMEADQIARSEPKIVLMDTR